MPNDPLEVRLRTVEFLLTHLTSKVRSADDLRADREDLKDIVERGQAWNLMPEVSRQTASKVVEAAI